MIMMEQHIPCKTLNVVTIDTAETILPSKSNHVAFVAHNQKEAKLNVVVITEVES